MEKTIEQLNGAAKGIRYETSAGENTADRVGEWMMDATDTLGSVKTVADNAVPKSEVVSGIGPAVKAKIPNVGAVMGYISPIMSDVKDTTDDLQYQINDLKDDAVMKADVVSTIASNVEDNKIPDVGAVIGKMEDVVTDINDFVVNTFVQKANISQTIGQATDKIPSEKAVFYALSSKASVNDISEIYHDLGVLNDDKIEKRDIFQVVGQAMDKVPSLKLFTDNVRDKIASDWNDALTSNVGVTLDDSGNTDSNRPSFLSDKGKYNVSKFSDADGEPSYLIDSIWDSKFYLYNPINGYYKELGSVSEMERCFLAGDYILPLTATGDGTGLSKLQIMTSESATLIISGEGRFYSDPEGTQGESRIYHLAADKLSDVYVKVGYGASYINIPRGLSIIKKLGGGYAQPLLITGNNCPMFQTNSSYYPINLITLSLHQARAIGEVKLSDMPSTLTTFGHSYGNGINKINLSGNLADIKSSIVEIFYTPNYQNNQMTGDIAELISRGVFLMHINSNKGYTYTSAVKPINQTIRAITIDTLNNTTWTSAMTDQFLKDMSTAEFVSEKVIKLIGLAPRTSASDTAITILQSKGVTITVNQ